MCRLCWGLALALLLSTLALVYVFVVSGNTLPATDGRTAIVLTPGERDLVLGEMRDFLVALQAISAAAAADDSSGLIEAARRVGGAAQQGVPASLVGKLPLTFKQLGFATHQRFDQLADNVQDLGDTGPALADMADLMRNCIACHATYRFELEQQ
jgi:hypothetical protein